VSWSDEHIGRIAGLFADTTGFRLIESRRSSVEAAILRTMKRCGFDNPADYERQLANGRSDLIETLVAELTIQESYFYRHGDQIDFIHEVIMPTCVAHNDHSFSCWSAGCANGQEVYTLAILAQTMIPTARVRVTGTDVSVPAIEFAKAARYREWSLRATVYVTRLRTTLGSY